MTENLQVHGTAVLLGSTGVLLRGPSGAGKSVLALALLDRWEGRGEDAFLVADDRVDIALQAERLVMRVPPPLAGLIELRGRGIVSRPYRDGVRLDLLIDLVPDFIRMLEEDELNAQLAGVQVARAPVAQTGLAGLGHQVLLVLEAIRALPSVSFPL